MMSASTVEADSTRLASVSAKSRFTQAQANNSRIAAFFIICIFLRK